MKKLLPIVLLLVACDTNYHPGIPTVEFDKLLDNCDKPTFPLEQLNDDQLMEYSRHQYDCQQMDNESHNDSLKANIWSYRMR